MNRTLFFTFTLVSLLACGNTQSEKENQTRKEAYIVFDSKIVDLGAVNEGDTLVGKFSFVNKSNSDLIIEYVNPDCICTSFTISEKKIRPGGHGLITLFLDTRGKVGEQKVYAVVKANTKSKFHRIIMKATVN